MILFRTIFKYKPSYYDIYKYKLKNSKEILNELDKNFDQMVKFIHDFYAVGEGIWGDYLKYNKRYVLEVLDVNKKNVSLNKDRWIIENEDFKIIAIEEITWKTAIKYKIPNLIYYIGLDNKEITNKMRQDAFELLSEEWLCKAGILWPGIPLEMKINKFLDLTGVWLHKASYRWDGMPDEMIKSAYKKLGIEKL